MRHRPLLVTALALAAGAACWSDVGQQQQQGATADSAAEAPGTGPGSTGGGVAQPAPPSGGPIPTATDTIGAAGRNPPDSGAGRAGRSGGTNAGTRDTARDSTRGARPPR